MDPDLVLVLFLPPLLYSAAFFASLRDLKTAPAADLAARRSAGDRHRGRGVGLVAHTLIDGMSWGAAFALGAIVAPTDPVAAAAIARSQRSAAADRQRDRGREPDQRRHGAGALPRRRRGGRRRQLLAAAARSFDFVFGAVGGIAVGLARRLADRRDPQAARGPAGRDHDLAGDRLRGLPAGRAARASPACSPRSPPASTSAGGRRRYRARRCACRGARSGSCSSSCSTRSSSSSIGLQLPVVADGLEAYSTAELDRLRGSRLRRGDRHAAALGAQHRCT